MKIKHLIHSDIVRIKPNFKFRSGIILFIYMFFSRHIKTIILIRLLQANPLVAFISSRILRRSNIEVGSTAIINEGFFLPHPWCVIIAANCVIGKNVSVGQYVTIGGNFKKTKKINHKTQKVPVIGNRVVIGPGAVIGGPVTIGNDVIIGANSVVTKDVPPNTIVYGQNKVSQKKVKILVKENTFVDISAKSNL